MPPDRIGKELARLARHPYVILPQHSRTVELPPAAEDDFRGVLYLLRTASGVDFTHYKPGTIRRRIARRMVLQKIESLKHYVGYLRQNRAELDALFQDLLIHVTSFFREPEAFKVLQTRIFPNIMAAKKPGGSAIRIWVPGCSTGEEVYSLAIALLEFLGERASSTPVQIFGTDISEPAIELARSGTYSGANLRDLSPVRLRRFFVRTDSGYRVNKNVREMCVFARQDVTRDPPFSRIDLISCRNLLIYLGAAAQRRIVAAFHYALLDTGFLVLGKSESLTGYADLFALSGAKARIYAKKASAGNAAPDFSSVSYEKTAPAENGPEGPFAYDALREADRMVWQRYAHAGLVLNDSLDILHFRGETDPYLSHASGKATLNALRMIREELQMELRATIHRARKLNAPVRSAAIRLEHKRGVREVSLEVVPLAGPGGKGPYFLVLFNELRVEEPAAEQPARNKRRGAAGEAAETARLRRELETSREYVRSVVEQQEAINEELKSANEEVLSSNEELQSTNEELETAKEELQSSNEELVTLNETLQARNVELAQLADDLNNLLSGTTLPILIVGDDRRIRRFTPAAEKLLNLLPGDVGRPISNIRSNIVCDDLDALIGEVSQSLAEQQREVRDSGGRWYSMRIRPYKTGDNRVGGVLIAFYDIDEIKRSSEALRETEATVSALVETLGRAILVVNGDGRMVLVNAGAEQMFGYRRDEILGQSVEMLVPEMFRGAHAKDRTGYFRAPSFRAMAPDRQPAGRRKDGTLFPAEVSLNSIETPHKRLAVALVADITELKRTQAALAEKEAALERSGEQLRALSAGLLTAQEEERERLARELHDDLNQRLAALALQTGEMTRQIPETAVDLRDKARALRASLGALSDDVHRMARELHPSILEHFGLAAALRSYCEEFSKAEDIKVQFRERQARAAIPADAALCLYRVAQESLRNIAKHSGAKAASVALAGAADAVRLAISDRGVGFDPDSASKGLGLVSIRERVRIAGGSVSIESRAGEGTRIEVRIPVAGGAV